MINFSGTGTDPEDVNIPASGFEVVCNVPS
jgi:hypothetical protein